MLNEPDDVPFIPFGRPSFGSEEIQAVTDVLQSGWVGMGEQVSAFERELAIYVGAPHVVAVSSCTGALQLSLRVLGISPGDEVICPSLTWCSTANAALQLGARAVFCDIEADSFLCDPSSILDKLTPRTRVVIVVHYGGLAVDVKKLRHQLPANVAIVEDAAHALGARYRDGTAVGSSGNLTCFSFYANKNLSTGEGGAIAVADSALAARLGELRQHGMRTTAWTRYIKPVAWPDPVALDELGYKLTYTDLQASIGRVQLRRQAEFAARRLAIARLYVERLRDVTEDAPCQLGVLLDAHARHLFVVRLAQATDPQARMELVQRARARGVGLSIHYPPLHRMPLYAHAGRPLIVTDSLADQVVTLPIGPAIQDDAAERVAAVFRDELRNMKRIPLISVSQTLTDDPLPTAAQATYAFGGRLTEAFPSQVLVDASEICNLACIHCPHPDFKASSHYARRLLDVELHAKMVDEVRRHGVGSTTYIRYASNGEPLTHPHMLPMLEHAVRESGVSVALTTNGTLLTEARAARIVESGVALVDISIDAITPETYAVVRVGGNLRKVERNVQTLIEYARAANSRTHVVVSFVEQPANRHETSEFARIWRDRGAAQVVIRRLHACSGAKDALAADRRAELSAETRRPCLYPWERMGLNAAGQLFFCPSDWVHGSSLADYRETTMREVWQGEAYQRLREAHLSNNYAQHPFCGQCPDWAATRWPQEGRSYADMVRELGETA
jgi:dTDP-4-amino-4,6-dideoxygalactose transaminase/MoaA/NifB/PqqE/SkfB family radical SAM enzyme